MTQTQFVDPTMEMLHDKEKVMFGTKRTSNEKWEPSPYSVRAFTATPLAEEERREDEKPVFSNVGKSEEDTLICDDKSREGEVVQIGLRNLQAQNPIKRNYDIDTIIQLDQNGIRNTRIQQTFGQISNNEYSNSPIQK